MFWSSTSPYLAIIFVCASRAAQVAPTPYRPFGSNGDTTGALRNCTVIHRMTPSPSLWKSSIFKGLSFPNAWGQTLRSVSTLLNERHMNMTILKELDIF
ncbi:MAG: hypothetical protein ACJAQU_001652 [Loktanella salsilacus]|jgi:hypothetical protein